MESTLVRSAHTRFAIRESSMVSNARRDVCQTLSELGCGEPMLGKAAIIVTELGTNLVRHTTQGGEILMKVLQQPSNLGVELISIDKGPGIEDTEHVLTDSVSTGGGMGTGLGAVRRLSHEFEIYSQSGRGTVILSRLWQSQPSRVFNHQGLHVEGLLFPKHGQVHCGDAWGWHEQGSKGTICIADGLGHGKEAAAAAQQAVQVFCSEPTLRPSDILRKTHETLRGTRGAVAAIVRIDPGQQKVFYSGIGNITGQIVSLTSQRSCTSNAGIVGLGTPGMSGFTYSWFGNETLILHSDGIHRQWQAADYPSFHYLHPLIVATLIYRDSAKGVDDVAIVVAQRRRRRW